MSVSAGIDPRIAARLGQYGLAIDAEIRVDLVNGDQLRGVLVDAQLKGKVNQLTGDFEAELLSLHVSTRERRVVVPWHGIAAFWLVPATEATGANR